MLHANDHPADNLLTFFHLFHALSKETVLEMTGKDRKREENRIGDLRHQHEHQGTMFDLLI